MKKYIAIFVALLFAFALSAVTFAAEKPMDAPKADTPKVEKKAAKAKTKQVTGEVTAVDAAAKSITVKSKKAEVTMTADEKMLADVKMGDKVTAKYTEKDGKMTAKSVKKAAAKAEKKAAAEKKAGQEKAAAEKKTGQEKAAAEKAAEPAKK